MKKKKSPKLIDLKKSTLRQRLFNDQLQHMQSSEAERKKNVRLNVVETQAIAARFKKSLPTEPAANIVTAKEILDSVIKPKNHR